MPFWEALILRAAAAGGSEFWSDNAPNLREWRLMSFKVGIRS